MNACPQSSVTGSYKSLLSKPLLFGIIGGTAVAIVVLLIGWFVTHVRQPQPAAAEQQVLGTQQAQVLEAAALDQLDAGHPKSADRLLSKAISLAPRRSALYYYRAVARSSLSRFEEAVADFDVAIEANPHWALPLAGRASAQTTLGYHDEAIDDFTKAIHLEPRGSMLYTNRGQVYHQRGRLELARDDFDTAVQLSPDSVAARFNRGVLLYALGKNDAAIADFSHAIAVDSAHAPPYFNRGLILGELGDTDAARADLMHFISLSDNPEWTQIAIETLANLGESDGKHD